MKKLIFTGIAIIACAALCSAVWPWNAGVEDLPAELNKNAVIGEIEARLEERPPILLSADTRTPELDAVTESKPIEIDITAEEKMIAETTPVTPAPTTANTPAPSSPKSGDRTIINGKPHIWVQGFGWVKDEGGGSVGIPVHGEGDINKQLGESWVAARLSEIKATSSLVTK